jgi:hypothetical protein
MHTEDCQDSRSNINYCGMHTSLLHFSTSTVDVCLLESMKIILNMNYSCFALL